MCCAVVAMCIAGGVEIWRQNECNSSSHLSGNISGLTIYVQLAQNIALGFSQLFAMVASCEYAYFAAPRSAQSLFMGLHFCAVGVGSLFGAAYMAFFSWIASVADHHYHDDHVPFSFQCPLYPDKKYWSFYTYFFVLAGVQIIVVFIFILCQRKLTIVKLYSQRIETNQSPQNEPHNPSLY